jgi:hypothetical protein
MGYDITAYSLDQKNITYMEAPANAFEKLKLLGYDWFSLIHAPECDGIVSGLGDEKEIEIAHIQNALKVLIAKEEEVKSKVNSTLVDPMGIAKIMEQSIQQHQKLTPFDQFELRYQMTEAQNRQAKYVLDELKSFMSYITQWAEDHKQSSIVISFN